MHQQIGRGDQIKHPQNPHRLHRTDHILDAQGVRRFFTGGIGDHRGGTINAYDPTGALTFQGPSIVAIATGDIQDREALHSGQHVKKGEGFTVFLDGQAFCLAIEVGNRIVVGHHKPFP